MDYSLNQLTDVLGISQVATELYLYLLEHGATKTTLLRKTLKLDKTSFYRSLHELEDNKLVTLKGAVRNQTILVSDPDTIRDLLNKKSEQVKSAQDALNSLEAKLHSLKIARYQDQNIQLFSGPDSYLRAMRAVIAGGGPTLRNITPDSAQLYALAGSKAKYHKIVKEIISTRLSQDISIKILLDQSAKDLDQYSQSNPETLKEVRQFTGYLSQESFLNTCGDKTLFYTQSADGCWGLIISDPLITSLLNSLFDVIWQQSTILD